MINTWFTQSAPSLLSKSSAILKQCHYYLGVGGLVGQKSKVERKQASHPRLSQSKREQKERTRVLNQFSTSPRSHLVLVGDLLLVLGKHERTFWFTEAMATPLSGRGLEDIRNALERSYLCDRLFLDSVWKQSIFRWPFPGSSVDRNTEWTFQLEQLKR